VDYHTVENRNKRKALQEKRNALKPQMEFVARTSQQGTQEMQKLLGTVEMYLGLAKHAETWEWKEVASLGASEN